MNIVECNNCGASSTCPVEQIGDTAMICEFCGELAIIMCGECNACNSLLIDEGDEPFEPMYRNYDEFPF